MEYVNKIKESASFQEGLATMRQLSFDYHGMARSRSNSNYRCKTLKPNNLQPQIVSRSSRKRCECSSHLFKEDIHQILQL
jgi:hypothetical protein